MERQPLTKDQVVAAERREEMAHPVISLLETHAYTLVGFREELKEIKDTQRAQSYIADTHGFLADSLEQLDSFTLQPLELVAIWSKAMEVMDYYQRHAFGEILAVAYAVQSFEEPKWQGLTRYLLETHQFPDDISADRNGLGQMVSKFDEISESMGELDFYVNGVEGSGVSLAAELAKKSGEGDADAGRKLEELIKHHKEHTTPTLAEIHENLSNGMVSVRMRIALILEGTSVN
ncbi:hypothetical protein A3A54_02050 [Candidatus Curtissbacteria bacterium RIFCSPLOWO2_01_FULL_39_62]|uniref:Uncharacterized protein n=2 Tax=Candidatus Curtissiibacteriota TaxID=1752717 RepID=A0A1F5G6T8_9BACT|nr:MAG: hypothetical protein A2775_00560 [Candidatus Curtissbacteria bacterium RIFCSPHIGHO2_01_FULL_39_57]OGD87561.1 MAG: hypothetical protein A3D04_04740 [Candidatus Curtissbacteria bacterium RIFCSPHIGHO2_02_FULL_40_16b]OGD90223.1 MAG: hypothetical protein A3E11_00475 [Candidatus Curtissbacteria bacterium RIFCSPHIGHO2_12_FULL_38_37]OGE00557.1 MAG: hypothetical protein A3A54_02050 [Candidatus Curtissbacteria bacterium RIFCSPLOWO2_01_FULL_39_62]OGE00928.1 MAG: hypothetical protein A3J17_03325 [C